MKTIRGVTPEDRLQLAGLFEAVGLFEPRELVELADMLQGYFAGDLGPEHHWLAYHDDAGLRGAAYYAPDASPERAAPGTWNLYFIGVLPESQGSGCGSALLRHVEEVLASNGAFDLLVETSGRESFEATRSFYRKHGYTVVTRVSDAYGAGDDKVIFRKRLAGI